MTRTFPRLFATTLVLLATMTLPSLAHEHAKPIGDAIKDVPLFDAHVHYKEPAWGPYPVESVVALMDQNGVAMALVSSTPDEGTIKLWEFAPNRIVPELRPYHGDAGSSNWAKADGMADYLRGRLAKYPHQGIGEFHIHNLDTSDEPLFREVIAMAKARDILLHVHSGAEPIRWLHSLDPEVKMIWAHAGLGEPATTVHALMAEIPGLLRRHLPARKRHPGLRRCGPRSGMEKGDFRFSGPADGRQRHLDQRPVGPLHRHHDVKPRLAVQAPARGGRKDRLQERREAVRAEGLDGADRDEVALRPRARVE